MTITTTNPGTAPSANKAVLLALRTTCAGLQVFFRHAPGTRGKQWVWDRVVRPHILWRSFPIEATTRFGARLHGAFPDLVHSFVYFFGIWEPAITAIIRGALRPGDVMVDVGANVGMHSLLAAKLVGPAGRVHAIEASPGIFARLRRNLQANAAYNVIPHNLAATAVAGRVPIYLHDDTNLGGTTILTTEAVRSGAALEAMVKGRPLPDIVPPEDLLTARLIKIDVEGAEWLVVQGMAELLPQLRPDAEILLTLKRASLEAAGGSVEMLLALFARAGFQPFEVPNRAAAGFYILDSHGKPAPLQRADFEVADIVFRRPPITA